MGYDWFRLHSRGWLHGSIRVQLTPAERSVWADLLSLANESRVRGIVCRAKGIPYTREYLANLLNIPVDLLNSTIDKCVKDENADDPQTRIMIDDDGCVKITNWAHYQAAKERSSNNVKPVDEQSPEEREHREKAITDKLARKHPDVAEKAISDKKHEEELLKKRQEELGKLQDKGGGNKQ